MKAIKISLLVLILLANAAFAWWCRRETSQCGEEDAADEQWIRRFLRWKYALFTLDIAYAVFSAVCVLLDI